MRFPWTKRNDQAKAETVQAQHEYEWAVQQRTTVSSLVDRVKYQGERNQVIENLTSVLRGGRK